MEFNMQTGFSRAGINPVSSIAVDLQLQELDRRITKVEVNSNNTVDPISLFNRVAALESKSLELGTEISISKATTATKEEFSKLKTEISNLKNSVEIVSSKANDSMSQLIGIKPKISRLDCSISGLDTRINEYDKELNSIDFKLTILETRFNDFSGEFKTAVEIFNTKLQKVDDKLIDISDRIDGIGDIHLFPITERLDKIELVNTSQTNDITNLETRIADIEGTAAPEVDLTAITDRLDAVELVDATQTANIVDLEARVKVIEDIEIPEVDLTPVTDRLDTIELSDTTQTTNINALRTDLDDSVDSINELDTRLTVLELGGGGGDGEVPIDLINRVIELESNVETIDNTVSSIFATTSTHTEELNNHKSRISEIEDVINADPTPRRWYILPIAGESSITGLGEVLPRLPGINPRLMQLGYNDSVELTEFEGFAMNRFNVPKECTIYGNDYRLYRPMLESNLKLIPSSYCLDNHSNLFSMCHFDGLNGNKRAGGLSGIGHYLAQLILPFIPEDYGIIVVDGSGDSTGFTGRTEGTYNQSTMRASPDSKLWGVNKPFGNQLWDRVKHAIDINPIDNILLPVIWMQGRSESSIHGHYSAFKDYVLWFRQKIIDGNYEKNLPTKSANDFRWLSFIDAGRSIHGSGLGNDYYDEKLDHTSPTIQSVYDNYAYLMNDPELQCPVTNDSYVYSIRVGLDPRGKFYETNAQGNSSHRPPLVSVIENRPDRNFSTSVNQYNVPGLILNAMSAYGKCLTLPEPTKRAIQNRGRTTTVWTDGCTFEYPTEIDTSFNPNTDSSLLYHHDFTISAVDAPTYIDETKVTFRDDGMVTTNDSIFGNVLSIDRSTTTKGSNITYIEGVDRSNYTISVMFKSHSYLHNTGDDIFYLIKGNTFDSPAVIFQDGSPVVYANYGTGEQYRKENVSINKSYFGAWHGRFEDWQHLTLSWHEITKHMHVYLNGCLIDSLHVDSFQDMTSLFFGSSDSSNGNKFSGNIATIRVYNRAISARENYAMYFVDYINKGGDNYK